MHRKTFLIIGVFFLLAHSVYAAEFSLLTRDLKVGDRGQDVLALQQILNKDSDTQVASLGVGSPGAETDYFGTLTKVAVSKFQNKYRKEVLYPAGIFAPTGYVGAMTRAKFRALATEIEGRLPVAITRPKNTRPMVSSVSPSRVRRGDTVTITGENFDLTNNTVILGDGPIDARFENLPSADGRTITFTYQPPYVPTMTETQVRALPKSIVDQIEKPAVAAGSTLAEALMPYKDIHNEAELKTFLEKNGRSFDEMYHKFWIIVRNKNGERMSSTALLSGLRSFPFDTVADAPSLLSNLEKKLSEFVARVLPTANASSNTYGGGLTSGVITSCTCGDGQLTFQLSYGGQGQGTFLYYFGSGYTPTVGSGKSPANWVGFFSQMTGMCWMQASYFCYFIIANEPENPNGYSLFP